MLGLPVRVDREIAAATFKTHLDALWASGRPERAGWGRIPIDDLHTAVALPSTRAGKGPEPYFLLLGAEYYDAWPVTAVFADPTDWSEAAAGSRWIPKIVNPPFQFALNVPYQYSAPYQFTQLLCFTGTANYYMVPHSPPEHTVWRKGDHNVSHTIARMAELLAEPYYQGASNT